MRIGIEIPGMRKEIRCGVTRFLREDGPGANQILHCAATGDELDVAVARQVADLRGLGRLLSWKVYAHDPGLEALRNSLFAHGFTCDDEPYEVVIGDLATIDQPRAGAAAEIRRVTEPDGVDEVIAILRTVHGGDFDWL